MRDNTFARRALALLDGVTMDLAAVPEPQRRDQAHRTLRQALGYGWSVVIAALPAPGLAVFERYGDNPDRDIAWIVRENRKKAGFERAIAGLG